MPSKLCAGRDVNLAWLLAFGILLQLAIAGKGLGQANSPDEQIIRVNAQLVQVDAQVMEKKTGRGVGSLGKDDFQLYEDGTK